jgi:hypothetical protein
MITKTIFSIIIILTLTSCSRPLLNFSTDKYFSIQELLNSKNCTVKCGEIASCEGKIIKLTGIIDEGNIFPETNRFRIYNKNKNKYSLFVSVTKDQINTFNFIQAHSEKTIKLIGKIKGFDRPMNFNCDKGFKLELIKIISH